VRRATGARDFESVTLSTCHPIAHGLPAEAARSFTLSNGDGLAYGPCRRRPMPSVYLKTYGCQMNERDSDAIAARFLASGYCLAASDQEADVVLLNTCSVRDMAEQKAIGKMTALVGAARKHRSPVVLGFLGCMAQSRGRELMDLLPGVRVVLGTRKLDRVVEAVEAVRTGRLASVVDTGMDTEARGASILSEHVLPAPGGPRPVTALVSIMQGCDQQCAFCIVPQTRGREQSRSPADLVAECRQLVARGVREVTLLGQIVTRYAPPGFPPANGRSPFVQLLEALHALDGLDRIRFASPHPGGYGADLVEAYARLPKLCEHAHLPAQSGSNRVLSLMRRGYTRERFLEVVNRLRQAQPGIEITTDLIVGFPGETDADFEQTLDLVQAARFQNAFVFKYSARRGTPAAAFPDQVSADVIEARHARLLERVNTQMTAAYQRMVGRRVQVLVEGPSRKNPARLEGRTRCGKIAVLTATPDTIGRLVEARVVHASSVTLYTDPDTLNSN